MTKRKTPHIHIPPFLIDDSNRLENFVLNNINIYKKLGYRDIWFYVMITYNQELENVLRKNGIRPYGTMFDGSFHHSKVMLNPTWLDKIRYRLTHTKTE